MRSILETEWSEIVRWTTDPEWAEAQRELARQAKEREKREREQAEWQRKRQREIDTQKNYPLAKDMAELFTHEQMRKIYDYFIDFE